CALPIWIGPGIHAHHIAGEAARGAPHGAVDGIYRHRIQTGDHALVLRRINRLVGLDPLVALAVAVGIEHERRPALRALLVARLFEQLAVEPADGGILRAAGAGPQRV